ncbi:hypothetical protein BKA70DRAFT_1123120 [Coprinopsis sp. MPI-PUGE-AT-0042]|nr:hypothetical protein BKA70DRAFT_1123116 [Coprinopsis sp. MPI-PUGE-AT-0042]KAH6886617.1 hypothetical protein BKA70DRAFT_1123120 [Coprinopsis sp. MPI-PUGE-AT-0042]
MLFRPPRKNRFPETSTQGPPDASFQQADTAPRAPYGAKVPIFPRVDLLTPSGSYVQAATARPAPAALGGVIELGDGSNPVAVPQEKVHVDKQLAQLRQWVDITIPEMVQPYLDMLAASQTMRNIDRNTRACTCANSTSYINVLCVYFDKLEYHDICLCSPSCNLIAKGFFPSTPQRPTVAFDLKMLEFMHQLHVRASPNITAWSTALEEVLESQGFKLASKDTLRRKLASSLRWFRFLAATKELVVDKLVSAAASDAPEGADTANSPDNHAGTSDESCKVPSPYLQKCCPLCFGGNWSHNPEALADVIVSVDANFQQKRRKPARGAASDHPFRHPTSLFLDEEEVMEVMEDVEQLRPSNNGPATSAPADDAIEPGMKVPVSALNGCHDSFTAADEKRTKASTQKFADTGVMGLLCRHDRPLFLANMTTPGERQFYVVALLRKLFQHIPATMTVGLLYDIGCQLERSCIKWDFLGDLLKRLTFGISVFHAYGHRWPCQLIYHPRKCSGFGLSDGEGCERFWSAIKLLIPSLRVSGKFQRLFTLDVQVIHLREQSLESVGAWIARKWTSCHIRYDQAISVLATKQWTRDEYQAQWEAQCAWQTRPLARVSKNAGKKAIEDLMALLSLRDSYAQEITNLDERLLEGAAGALQDGFEDLQQAREVLVVKKLRLEASITTKKSLLGVEGKENFARLMRSDFLRLKVNTHAVKSRLLASLQNRRFEMERFEKLSQMGSSSEQKLQSHVETQLQKHRPQISNLVKKYNTMCAEISQLISSRPSLQTAVAPIPVDPKSVFDLDVDNPIWDDTFMEDDLPQVPLWMGNDDMRQGIRSHLQLLRCAEEKERLCLESQNLQGWSFNEWGKLTCAINQYDDNIGLAYELSQRQVCLLRRIAIWQAQLQELALPSFDHWAWGPSQEQLAEARTINSSKDFSFDHLSFNMLQSGIESDEDSEWNSEADDDVWDMSEMIDIMDDSELFPGFAIGDSFDASEIYESSIRHSPNKRSHNLDSH